MLEEAAAELDLELRRSYMVGDKQSDVEAGRDAGCRTVLFAPVGRQQAPPATADLVAAEWPEIERYILGEAGRA
jgi:phosphoglycolate phosphatase-like HAD superfamily hydrolase